MFSKYDNFPVSQENACPTGCLNSFPGTFKLLSWIGCVECRSVNVIASCFTFLDTCGDTSRIANPAGYESWDHFRPRSFSASSWVRSRSLTEPKA